MKDIILWQTAAAREREKQYVAELVALHQSVAPPIELLSPRPRKLRWRRTLKFIVAFEGVVLAFAICAVIWCAALEIRFDNENVLGIKKANERLRSDAARLADPQKKAKIENSIRENESLAKKWQLLEAGILTAIFIGILAGPVGNLCLMWYLHARPELILLQQGVPVRATVACKRRVFLATHLETEFTTDRGETICKKQILRGVEGALFQIGSPVWMLYSPARPSRAKIYGLESALAEVEP